MTLSMMADLAFSETGFTLAIAATALMASLLVVAFVVAAVFSILFSRMDGAMKIVWLIFVVIAPVIGAILWFLIGRSRAPAYRYTGYR